MTGSQPGLPLSGLRPEAVARVIELLSEQAEQLTAGDRGYHDDPLSYAWLTCLEAAASVGRAIAIEEASGVADGDGDAGAGADGGAGAGAGVSAGSATPDRADDELQEAWAATRGAATSVRLSLYRRRRRAAV